MWGRDARPPFPIVLRKTNAIRRVSERMPMNALTAARGKPCGLVLPWPLGERGWKQKNGSDITFI